MQLNLTFYFECPADLQADRLLEVRSPRRPPLPPRVTRLQPCASRLQPHMSRLQPCVSRLQPCVSRLQPYVFRLQPCVSQVRLPDLREFTLRVPDEYSPGEEFPAVFPPAAPT